MQAQQLKTPEVCEPQVSNLDKQRMRITRAIIQGIKDNKACECVVFTLDCENERLTKATGSVEVHVWASIGVDEYRLQWHTRTATGWVYVVWGNGTGCSISDFSINTEAALKEALEIAEYLDV